jgi:hypothetical protein
LRSAPGPRSHSSCRPTCLRINRPAPPRPSARTRSRRARRRGR